MADDTLAGLFNVEALKSIIIEAARRGDIKVGIPGDIVKKLLGDQSEAAAKIIAGRVSELALELAKNISRTVEFKVPDHKAQKIDRPHCQLEEVLSHLLALAPEDRNVFLVGPAGSGKTTAAKHLGKALSVPCFIQGAILTRYELDGFIDGNGKYHATQFRRFCESAEGGVFGQDEVDGSEAKGLLPLQTYTANGEFTFPDGFVAKRTERHYVVAMGNTYGNGASRIYVGRNQLDGATLDRYLQLDWGYDEDLEAELVSNTKWHNRVKAVRRAVDGLKLRHTVTPRDARRGSRLIASGVDFAKAELLTLKRSMAQGDWDKVIAACK